MTDASASDRELLRRSHPTLGNDVSLIASEFLAGFQLVQQIDRPAVSIFGSFDAVRKADIEKARRMLPRSAR